MKILKLISVFLVAVLLSIPPVFAFWEYPSHVVSDVELSLSVTKVSEFLDTNCVYIKSIELISTSNVKVLDDGHSMPTTKTVNADSSATNGSVTYKVTLHNNTNLTYWYTGMTYSATYGNNTLINASNGIKVTTKDHSTDSSATFNGDDWIPPKTERDIYITYSYGSRAQSACATEIVLNFNLRLDAIHDEFLELLNNSPEGTGYYVMVQVLDALYKANKTTTITTESHPELFTEFFGDLSVNIDGTEKVPKVVIRRENLDKDSSTGDNYSNGGPAGCEYTVYITVEDLTPGSTATVYAISYSKGADGMGDDWYQIGELYEGKAPIKADGSIDYTKWKAVHKTYEIADGIKYIAGAPNGDQYDIMNTMEQLISAVDQDIFNDIDNTQIFKKVYNILVANQNSDDPAVIALRKAFEDASIFYRNLNNGQEFKVVRDKYTRAEIIHALRNIQDALDYYYQTDRV